MLDARLAAESGALDRARGPGRSGRSNRAGGRRSSFRPAGVRFDLDGVAKGWLADRAADLLDSYPGVAVDADGDISLRAGPGHRVADRGGRSARRRPAATRDHAIHRRRGVVAGGRRGHLRDNRSPLADRRWRRHPPSHRSAYAALGRHRRHPGDGRGTDGARGRDARQDGAHPGLGLRHCRCWRPQSRRQPSLLLDTGELLALPGTEAWLA